MVFLCSEMGNFYRSGCPGCVIGYGDVHPGPGIAYINLVIAKQVGTFFECLLTELP